MENKENKELFSLRPVLNTTPKGFVDLSTVKESGASKIYKTKSAAKAQATRKKNKAISKARKESMMMKERLKEEERIRALDRKAEQKYLLNKIAKVEKALQNNQGGGKWSVTYKVNGR